jgi:hypothetical protein
MENFRSRFSVLIWAALAAATPLQAQESITNIALGKTVATKGVFFGHPTDGLVTDFSTLTNGQGFEIGHSAIQGPIWWNADEPNFLTVFLESNDCTVGSLRMQMDNDDSYSVSWWDSKSNGTRTVEVSAPSQPGTGMSPFITVAIKVPATTKAFTIEPLPSDNGNDNNFYALSEFQALGTCLPSRDWHDFTKDQCKKNGWKKLGFKNQGQCIRFVNTGKDSRD